MYHKILWMDIYQVIITVGSEEARNKALESFAINSNGSIKVAYLKGEVEQVVTNDEGSASDAESTMNVDATSTKNSDGSKLYTISNSNSRLYSSNISYRKVIQDYILPFEFLWAIVVIGDSGSRSSGNSEDLAHAIASMAYDGEIRLIVDDNSSEVTTDEVTGFNLVNYHSYTEILLKREGHVISNGKEINEKLGSNHYVSTYTKIEANSSPVLRIRKIEGWSAIYDKTPSYANNITQSPVEQDESVDDTSSWDTETKEEHNYKYDECPDEPIKSQFESQVGSDSQLYSIQYNEKWRSRKENVTKTTSQNTVSKTYGNASSITPDFNQDIADIFNVNPFSSAKRYITKSSYSNFMEVIETNSSTANMVDLVNYIFNQVTGTTKYGEDLEWEKVWKSSGFSDSSGGKVVSADTIQAKVWFSLKDEGYSDVAVAAVMGNIEGESGFNPGIVEGGSGVGFGLCQWSYERRTALEGFAKSRGVDPSDEDLQIEFLIAELKQGGGADGYATYQFSGHEADRTTWTTSSDIAEATTAFCAGFERPGVPRNEARISAAKKYYDEFHGAKLGSGSGSIEGSDTLGIKGYYTAEASGRKFTLYSQNIQGSAWYWDCGCFVTSQATIASGYGSKLTPNQFTGFGGMGLVSDFETKCGCKYKREHSLTASQMKQYLKEGKAIMIELMGVTLKTDNGSAYYSQHYVSVLDYKEENGVDKVYVHDPWDGSASYGWANINDIVSVSTCFDSVWK